jgi:hypothetical protein
MSLDKVKNIVLVSRYFTFRVNLFLIAQGSLWQGRCWEVFDHDTTRTLSQPRGQIGRRP